MRKITSLLMLLCMFVGTAWGQVTNLEDLSNDKAYVVQCKNGQWWTFNDKVPSMMSNTQTAGQEAKNDNVNQHFAFLKSGDKVYLYSIAAKKFVNKHGGGTLFVEYPEHTIEFLVASDDRKTEGYPHVVSLNKSHLGVSPGFGDQQGVITHYNDLNDKGNAIKIVEAGAFASTEAMAKITLGLGAERNAFLNEIAIYTAKYDELENTVDQKAKDFKSSIEAASTLSFSPSATADDFKNAVKAMKTAYAALFVKLSELESGVAYRFKNFKSERYLTVVTENVEGVQIKDYSENINQIFYITKSSNNASYYNIQCCSGKYVTALSNWDVKVQDNACDFNIVVSDEGLYKIRRTDKDHTEHNVGPNSGAIANGSPLYSNHNESNISCEWLIETVDLEKLKVGLTVKQAAIAFEPVNAIGTCTATEEQKAKLDAGVASLNNLTALIEYDSMLDAILATSKPMTAGLYFIKNTGEGSGNNANWYVTYGANGTDFMAMTLAEGEKLGAKHVWSIEASDDAYKFQSCNLGKYPSLIAAGATSQITSDVAGATKFKFTHNGAAKFTIRDSDGRRMRTEGTGAINHWGTDYENNETWYIIPATTIDITIGEAGYATTYLPFDVTLPNTVKAYAVNDIEGEYAKMEKKTDIPAKNGAILEGKGTHTLTIAEANSDWSGNLLEGTFVNTYVGKGAYVLAKKDGVIGFYKAAMNFAKNGEEPWAKVEENGTHFLNNANKAYLPASAVTGNARFISFDFGTETAIDELKGENVNVKTVIYDLAGRRVQGAQKGIFIVNGKKVVK